MKKINLLFFLIIITNCYLFAQANEDSVSYKFKGFIQIDSIRIIGNEITDNDIILRELTFEIGDSVDNKILKYNKERIFSLDIFTSVKLFPVKGNNINILIISVEESWYIYPLPFAELKDRDWNKFSYGLDLVLKNFRGRNETLRGRFQFGYDPSLALTYINPWLIKEDDIFLRTDISYTNAENKSSNAYILYGNDFDQKFISGGITVGKRFGLYNRFSLNAGYSYIESPFYIKGINASNSRIDRTPFAGIGYSYDSRDLAQFPREGIFFNSTLTWKGMGVDNINYNIFTLDFREYRLLFDDLGSKWRLATRLAYGGVVPFYDYSYLGYSERIRGHFNDEKEGHYSYIGSFELNYPVIKEWNLKLHFIPIIPDELLTYRIAIYSHIFVDAGTTRLRNQPISFDDFDTGYGTGITFLILPYNILRIDFALDEFFNTEWIIDLGISF